MELKEIINQLSQELGKTAANRNIISQFDELKKQVEKDEKKYKKKVIDLYTIFEIAKDLSSSLSINNLIKTIILTSVGHTLAETAVLFVLDEKSKTYFFRDGKGIKQDMSDISFDQDDELVQNIIRQAKPVFLKDIIKEKFAAVHSKSFKRLNCHLLVPIMIKTKLNGILFLGPKSGGMPFTDPNIEFLVTLGNFAAIAIENARLYEDLNRRVKDLSTLYNISKEINKSNDMDLVLDLMLDTITTGFGVKKCSIILYDELKNVFKIERNYQIEETTAKKYFSLILEKKINNPLLKNEPVLADHHKSLSGNDIFFSVPLIAGSKKVGLLNIYQFEENLPVDDEVKQIFSIIASQMAPPLVLTQFLSK
ncbi:MAG: GAF domain-containing protein, partial [Spirochaetes bacterium]|nr:GAF domain-containing protein [Spirochaetota bacterium]